MSARRFKVRAPLWQPRRLSPSARLDLLFRRLHGITATGRIHYQFPSGDLPTICSALNGLGVILLTTQPTSVAPRPAARDCRRSPDARAIREVGVALLSAAVPCVKKWDDYRRLLGSAVRVGMLSLCHSSNPIANEVRVWNSVLGQLLNQLRPRHGPLPPRVAIQVLSCVTQIFPNSSSADKAGLDDVRGAAGGNSVVQGVISGSRSALHAALNTLVPPTPQYNTCPQPPDSAGTAAIPKVDARLAPHMSSFTSREVLRGLAAVRGLLLGHPLLQGVSLIQVRELGHALLQALVVSAPTSFAQLNSQELALLGDYVVDSCTTGPTVSSFPQNSIPGSTTDLPAARVIILLMDDTSVDLVLSVVSGMLGSMARGVGQGVFSDDGARRIGDRRCSDTNRLTSFALCDNGTALDGVERFGHPRAREDFIAAVSAVFSFLWATPSSLLVSRFTNSHFPREAAALGALLLAALGPHGGDTRHLLCTSDSAVLLHRASLIVDALHFIVANAIGSDAQPRTTGALPDFCTQLSRVLQEGDCFDRMDLSGCRRRWSYADAPLRMMVGDALVVQLNFMRDVISAFTSASKSIQVYSRVSIALESCNIIARLASVCDAARRHPRGVLDVMLPRAVVEDLISVLTDTVVSVLEHPANNNSDTTTAATGEQCLRSLRHKLPIAFLHAVSALYSATGASSKAKGSEAVELALLQLAAAVSPHGPTMPGDYRDSITAAYDSLGFGSDAPF